MLGNSSGRVAFFLSRAILLTGIVSFASACGDDHNHGHHQNSRRSTPFSSWSLTPPSRPLEWGDLNVLHTTDTHGWLLGHQKLSSPPEPNYSGTLGDFADFVQHMKKIADEKGVDLLLVDSGDVHDGTGLSDGFPSGGVDAHDSNQFLKQLPYDLLAIGNHELYIYNNTLDTHNDFAPHWQGRYLSSNVNITIPNSSDPSQNVSIPVGERYVKFKTKFGRRVTSLGVLYDFTGNDVGTTVQKVEDMIKEQWASFAEAIAEEPDLFLLVGHMPVQEDNWPIVFDAVRAVHPTTPILIFGGHTHIRDCVQFDDRSMALESGRYMETVGWMSVNLDNNTSSDGSPGNLTFSRRYLDANRLTYEFHTGRNNHSFDTSFGQSITRGLENLAERFDLNFTFGISPRDYSISRDPYPSNGSSLTLFIEQAVPIALSLNNTLLTSNASNTSPALFLTNSGSQRFDIFKGPFTKNDELTASPFADAFLFIKDVRFGVAKQVVDVLNEEGGEVFTVAGKRELNVGKKGRWMEELYKRGDVEMRYRAWLAEMYARAKELDLERREDLDEEGTESVKTLGYVTSDSCPGIGDDTPHVPLPFFPSPAYISSIDSSTSTPKSTSTSTSTSNSSSLNDDSLTSTLPSQLTNVTDSMPIDLVFVDFIASDVLSILNQLESESGAQGNASGSGKVYSEGDVQRYSDLLASEVLGVFAGQVWN